MMMTSMQLIFMMSLFYSSLLALTTNNWFQLWISLELNMMFFIPIMFNMDNLSINSMMKYYIIQTIASSIFIFMMLMNQNMYMYMLFNNMISLMMTMKLGLFPIYFWYPQVSEGLNWFSFTLMSTWQKIIPLYIMSLNSKYFYSTIIMLSTIIGCFSMLNQNSLRKMFAFSSLTHMSWMLLAMMSKNNHWYLYFFLYTMIMISIYILMNKQNISSTNTLKMMNKSMNMKLMNSMMSLGGLPPLLGFFPKLLILNSTPLHLLWIMFILIISSLVSIFIYIQMMFPMIFSKILVKPTFLNNNYMYIINTLSLTPILFLMIM